MINFGKESEILEFKKSTSELNEAIVSIVAMLNKSGKGKILFGVKNNGDGVGQQLTENTLRDISRRVAADIKPPIYPSIYELANTPGIIGVEFIGNDKPYSANGKFYIRSFDEDKQLDVKTLLKMINKSDSSNANWENLESDDTIEDVDEDLLKQYILSSNKCGRISESYSNKQETLRKLGLVVGKKLTNAGRILFSKNKPLTLKLAVFATDEKLSFIDIKRVEGNLFELSIKGQQYIKEHINYKAQIVKNKRIEIPEIPEEAIREVVMNSLCHSSFATTVNNEIYLTPSKIAVFNPGTFPSDYSPEDFAYKGVESVLRNPTIAKILYYSNDIDSWATGFRRIYKSCEEYGVKTAYEKKNQGFEFCFYRKQIIEANIDLQEKVLALIRTNSNITTSEMAQILTKSRRTIQNVIYELKISNRLERVGSLKTGYWKIL